MTSNLSILMVFKRTLRLSCRSNYLQGVATKIQKHFEHDRSDLFFRFKEHK